VRTLQQLPPIRGMTHRIHKLKENSMRQGLIRWAMPALAGAMLAMGAISAAQAATVYCPNGPSGSLVAPTSGRYVQVTNAQNPGTCYFQEGNLQVGGPGSDIPAVAASAGVALANFSLLDLNGSSGALPGSLGGSFINDSTSGSWSVASSLWSSYSRLFLGFHFGNGGGSPDSFVVELQSNQTSGLWDFLAATGSVNGLSNRYLFGVPGGGGGNQGVPEPGTLLLAGVALLAARTAVRKR
jgi:hypothetical protein